MRDKSLVEGKQVYSRVRALTVGCCHKGGLAASVQAGVIVGRGLSKDGGTFQSPRKRAAYWRGQSPPICSSQPWLVSQATWRGGKCNKEMNKDEVGTPLFGTRQHHELSFAARNLGLVLQRSGEDSAESLTFWHKMVWWLNELPLRSVRRILSQANCL